MLIDLSHAENQTAMVPEIALGSGGRELGHIAKDLRGRRYPDLRSSEAISDRLVIATEPARPPALQLSARTFAVTMTAAG